MSKKIDRPLTFFSFFIKKSVKLSQCQVSVKLTHFRDIFSRKNVQFS